MIVAMMKSVQHLNVSLALTTTANCCSFAVVLHLVSYYHKDYEGDNGAMHAIYNTLQ